MSAQAQPRPLPTDFSPPHGVSSWDLKLPIPNISWGTKDAEIWSWSQKAAWPWRWFVMSAQVLPIRPLSGDTRQPLTTEKSTSILRSQKQQEPQNLSHPTASVHWLGAGEAGQSPSPGPQTSPVTAEQALWTDGWTDGLTDVQGRGRKTDPSKAGGRGTGTEGPSSHMQASGLLKRRAEAALSR